MRDALLILHVLDMGAELGSPPVDLLQVVLKARVAHFVDVREHLGAELVAEAERGVELLALLVFGRGGGGGGGGGGGERAKLRVEPGHRARGEARKALLVPAAALEADVDARAHFVPAGDGARVGLAAVEPGLLLAGVDGGDPEPAVSFALRQGALEAPVAPLGVAGEDGVDLGDARMVGRKFGLLEERSKRARRRQASRTHHKSWFEQRPIKKKDSFVPPATWASLRQAWIGIPSQSFEVTSLV